MHNIFETRVAGAIKAKIDMLNQNSVTVPLLLNVLASLPSLPSFFAFSFSVGTGKSGSEREKESEGKRERERERGREREGKRERERERERGE